VGAIRASRTDLPAQFRNIVRPAATAGATVNARQPRPRATSACRDVVTRGRALYLPFSFVMSPVDGLFIILSGAVVVALELASGAVVPDGALDDDGGEAGLIDELDDFESVLGGGAADFEGDGATTGGVVEVDDVVLDSRWQPATPSAMPVQSNVTRAALLIVISKSVNEGTHSDLADSMP